ncbi:hypothetical protein HPB51_009762 [Rhipicephalus microplus]|uniref:Uncharacterized protein n=1 Tax=Rhipicephalus microplus TaxID=6941 RepID=A0A9J6F098_RHIMP|nr:hypothetical protein HPB51_009762 [Rhipicephalus microplus]
MIKKQLVELVASVKSRFLSYIVDNTAVRAGCIVLRCPPYHCDFNTIELVWPKVENGVAANNRDFKLSTIDAILKGGIKQVMAEDWRKSIQHVTDMEAKFRLGRSGKSWTSANLKQQEERLIAILQPEGPSSLASACKTWRTASTTGKELSEECKPLSGGTLHEQLASQELLQSSQVAELPPRRQSLARKKRVVDQQCGKSELKHERQEQVGHSTFVL